MPTSLIKKSFNEYVDGFCGSIEYRIFRANDEIILKWLDSHVNAGHLAGIISESSETVLLIENISIEAAYQGNGFGSMVLSATLRETTCDSAILICDLGEIQRSGFHLIDFYKGHGFGVVDEDDWQAIMAFPEGLARVMRQEHSSVTNFQLAA